MLPIDLPAPPVLAGRSRYVLAFSGGVDSTFLLHALQDLRRLTVIHVDHRLQRSSRAWARHCARAARALGVPFETIVLDIDPGTGAGPEAAARLARYAALRARMHRGDCLITAHHRDDQAETVLLRALRGSGIDGLAAMRPVAPFAPGILWRPLLGVGRAEILAAARAAKLRWIEDPHNADPRFARSRLRRLLMPALERQAPGVAVRLARLADHAADAAEVLAEVAQADLAAVQDGDGLGVARVLALSPARRRNVLRAWLAHVGLPPQAESLARLEQDVLRSGADAAPLLRIGTHEVRRYRDRLFVAAPLPEPPGAIRHRWNGRRALRLAPGCGALRLEPATTIALEIAYPTGGERLKPACGGPTRSLKNLFQEAGVPPWVRQRTPLLYQGAALRCVGDWWCDHEWASRGVAVRWDVELPGRPRGERGCWDR